MMTAAIPASVKEELATSCEADDAVPAWRNPREHGDPSGGQHRGRGGDFAETMDEMVAKGS